MYCTNCGSNLGENVKFCVSCGTANEQIISPQADAPSASQDANNDKQSLKKKKKAPIVWESIINQKNYTFSYQKIKGKHTLTVNGVSQTLKCGFMSALFGFDEEFNLDGTNARLVIEKKIPDIVVDDVYVQSGKKYIKRPKWVIVFVIICLLVPVVTIGGAIPALIGFGGAALCVSVSKSALSTAIRVVLCSFISLAAWILFLIFGYAVSTM